LVSIDVQSQLFEKNPVNQFFRHLRNAVAHVRFEVNEQGDFTFWDQKDDRSPQTFRATFSQTALQQFLSKVGPLLADLHFQNNRDQGPAS
jgi:hypothetical protein